MKTYPIVFSFPNVIIGRNFITCVKTNGRAMLVNEKDGYWCIYGVNPGALAGGGETKDEAFSDFHYGFNCVLSDIISEVSSLEEFKKRVKKFFTETDNKSVKEWEDLRDKVRKSSITLDDIKRVSSENINMRCDVSLLEPKSGPTNINVIPSYAGLV